MRGPRQLVRVLRGRRCRWVAAGCLKLPARRRGRAMIWTWSATDESVKVKVWKWKYESESMEVQVWKWKYESAKSWKWEVKVRKWEKLNMVNDVILLETLTTRQYKYNTKTNSNTEKITGRTSWEPHNRAVPIQYKYKYKYRHKYRKDHGSYFLRASQPGRNNTIQIQMQIQIQIETQIQIKIQTQIQIQIQGLTS